jgi:hypothetical protein
MNEFLTEWLYFPLLLLPFLAYAEIHFRFPFLPSRLFQKEPEIIFDLPHRGQQGEEIPLILLIKDAHRFPVQIADLQVILTNSKNQESVVLNFPLNIEIKEKFYLKIIPLEPANFPQAGEYQLSAKLNYCDSAKNKRTIVQDNYKSIPHPPFHIFISRDLLPCLDDWYWGDLHVHSNYTDDQVEFGAPIEAAVAAAKSIGLDFIAITDHSYDLDDDPENCLVNRPDIPKWNSFQLEVKRLQSEQKNFVIIPGEEVSAGNHRHKNVHCQILNDPQFHPGNGDSAERLFRHRPTMMLNELLERKASSALSIAAHPREVPPFSQRLILGRGSWDEKDCLNTALDALQILNNGSEKSFYKGLELWKQLLLSGRKIGIVAGNDAHGNFNCFRQIAIPFLKMVYHRKHLFGQARTAVKCKLLNTPSIIEAIRQLRVVISNGPFAIMEVKGDQPAELGNSIPFNPESRLLIHGKCIPEYGHWKELRICLGNYQQKEERIKTIPITQAKLEIVMEYSLADLAADYIRLEAYSQRNQYKYFCLTNPIWFLKE